MRCWGHKTRFQLILQNSIQLYYYTIVIAHAYLREIWMASRSPKELWIYLMVFSNELTEYFLTVIKYNLYLGKSNDWHGDKGVTLIHYFIITFLNLKPYYFIFDLNFYINYVYDIITINFSDKLYRYIRFQLPLLYWCLCAFSFINMYTIDYIILINWLERLKWINIVFYKWSDKI